MASEPCCTEQGVRTTSSEAVITRSATNWMQTFFLSSLASSTDRQELVRQLQVMSIGHERLWKTYGHDRQLPENLLLAILQLTNGNVYCQTSILQSVYQISIWCPMSKSSRDASCECACTERQTCRQLSTVHACQSSQALGTSVSQILVSEASDVCLHLRIIILRLLPPAQADHFVPAVHLPN